MLSDEDFNKVQTLVHPLLVREKITDEKGYYITNWSVIQCDARRKLVEFIILNIIPPTMQQTFWEHRQNITQMNKLTDLSRTFFKP